MVERELIAEKLALIEKGVRSLRSGFFRPGVLSDNKLQDRSLEIVLQVAVDAVLEVAFRIVSAEGLGEPRTNRELWDLLQRSGWIPPDLATTMGRMAFENMNMGIVREIVEHHLDDLLAFAAAVRARLG